MQILPKETTYVSICSFTRTMNHKTHYLCSINQGKCHAEKKKAIKKIKKTHPTDITILMDIFEQAKHIMRKDGNMLQWRGNYPSREIVIADIEQGNSYVCTDDTEEIIGTFAFIRGNDPTYTHIYEGKWVEDTLPYGVIHRLASTEHSKGVANACLQWCYEQIPNLRADTHRDNHILQYILKKHGFKYCGIILLANGDERLAFQKVEG